MDVHLRPCAACGTRMAIDINADEPECEHCGYTGSCHSCGDPVEPDGIYQPTACSVHCRRQQLDEEAAGF